MRRERFLAPMTALLLLLSACGADAQTEWRSWQEELRAAPEICFDAEIVSRTETDALTFSARVLAAGDTVTMTLTAPETLRGLSVVTRREGRSLRIEDTDISLTAGRGETLSPSEAGAVLIAALREGHILYTGAGADRGCAAFTGPRDETVTVRLSPEGQPVSAEIARGERTELHLSITDWSAANE